MKKAAVALIGAVLMFGTLVTTGSFARAANQADLPKEATGFDSLVDVMTDLRALQAAELTVLDAQQKFFEIVRMSFEGGRELTNAFSNNSIQTGSEVFGSGVTLVLDAKLAQMWLRGAAPSMMLIREVWGASRGDVSVMRATAQKVWASVQELWAKTPFKKNVVATAALGTFAYVQYETYWVINMSETQYQANIHALDSKINALSLQKQEIADQFNSVFAK